MTHGKIKWMLRLAVAAVPLLVTDAMAQVPANQGNPMDANTRVGSGGRNDVAPNPAAVTGNQIITGNVTGDKQFRGPVPYTDPNELRVQSGFELTDRFIRRSAGTANAEVADQLYTNAPRPYYGQSRLASPPQGYVSQGYGTGAYVPESIVIPQDRQIDRPFTQVPLGDTALNNPQANTAVPMTGPGTMGTPWSPSPLRPGMVNEPQYNLSGLQQGQLEISAIDRMRQELIDATGADTDPDEQAPLDASGAPAPMAVDLRVEPALAEPATGLLRQRTRQQLNVPPELQSTQYAELRRRLEQIDQEAATDEQAYRAFQNAQQTPAQQPMVPGEETPLTPGTPQTTPMEPVLPGQTVPEQTEPGGMTPGEAFPGQPVPETAEPQSAAPQDTPIAPPMVAPSPVMPTEVAIAPTTQSTETTDSMAARTQPMEITSLASGVAGEGLASLLAEAETNLRNGDFDVAVQQYRQAAQVAPNNPLIQIGLANAHLGAGLYTRAAGDLRHAFSADPALLAGRFDVEGFLGEGRVQALKNDLRRIAMQEQDQAGPLLLLAYLNYNTGDASTAADDLNQAAERSPEDAALYDQIRHYWNLSGNTENK